MVVLQAIISFLWGCWAAAQTSWVNRISLGITGGLLADGMILGWIAGVILLELAWVLFFG